MTEDVHHDAHRDREPPRHAVVIGGASGIGQETGRLLAERGWRVTLADLQEDLVGQAVAGLVSTGPGRATAGHAAHPVDVTDEASVEHLFTTVDQPDLVVTTAGTSTLGEICEHDAGEFRRIVEVCLTGSFLVFKHAGRRMRPGGSMVAVASLNARQPGTGMAAYCSAKAGLVMLAQVAALEMGPKGVRVNTVSPGFVPTPLTEAVARIPGLTEDYLDNTPLGRTGSARDVAEAIVYLADAAWLTGENLDLNGGAHLMRYPDLMDRARKAFA